MTRRCGVFNLGLPRLPMRIIVLQKNCFVKKIFLDCVLKYSTINHRMADTIGVVIMANILSRDKRDTTAKQEEVTG
jgi:hypothetical protein